MRVWKYQPVIFWCQQVIAEMNGCRVSQNHNIYWRTSTIINTGSAYHCNLHVQSTGYRCLEATTPPGITTSRPSHSSWESWDLTAHWCRPLLGTGWGPYCERSWPYCHGFEAWVLTVRTCITSLTISRGNSLHVITGHYQEEYNLMKFWEVEDTAIKSTEHDRDTEFLKSYSTSHISRLTDRHIALASYGERNISYFKTTLKYARSAPDH